jgi:FSR family fosmidomycin resistance protein-like MFS transporter
LSQTFGRRHLLTIGFAMSALAFLAMGFTSNISVLALLFFIAGAGGSTYHPNGAPLLAEIYPTKRGQILGLHQTGGAIGSVVGPIVTGFLALNFTWRPTLIILAVPGLVLAAILWFSISPKQPSAESVIQQTSKIGIQDIKTYIPIILFMITAFIYVLGLRGTDAFANLYFVNGRGIGFLEASLLFSALKVAGLFSAPLCGKLSDIYDRKKVLIALVIIESVSLYAITITPVALLAVPCITFGFAAFGLLGIGEALLADITPEKQRSAIFGINFTVNFSSSIFLPPVLGFISDNYNYELGFVLLSALMPLSIPLLLKIKTAHTQPAQRKKAL